MHYFGAKDMPFCMQFSIIRVEEKQLRREAPSESVQTDLHFGTSPTENPQSRHDEIAH